MNRAILIVICDFLVSAMLSMMTGMVAGHSGGTGVGLDENTTRMLLVELENNRRELESMREQLRRAADSVENVQELKRLARQLAENRLKQETLKKQLAATKENTGELSPAQLKKLLDEEKVKLYAAEIELQTRKESHLETRKELDSSRKEASELRKNLRDTAKAVSNISRDYAETKSKLAGTEEKLAGTEKILEAESRRAKRAENDLGRVSEALREMTRRFGDANQQAQQAQNNLAYVSGKLQSTERDAADYKGQNERMRREIAQLELNHRDAVRSNEELSRKFRQLVRAHTSAEVSLAKANKEVQTQRENAVRAQARFEAARQQLNDARKLLKTDVLELYSKASVALKIEIKARSVFSEISGGGVYYLPVVDFNGSLRVPGAFSTLCGDGEKPLIFNRVKKLLYTATPAADPAAAGNRISGYLASLTVEPRIASLKAENIPGITPLKYLDRVKLRKRGFQQLVLFKNSSGKRDVVDLENRCSMDLAEGDSYLFIRNDSRTVRAAAGDIILTREGDFAGIVTAVERMGERARVYLFPPENVWSKTFDIPIEKIRNSYEAFANGVKRHKERIFQLEKR